MFLRNTILTIIIVTGFFGGLELLLAAFGVRPMLLSEDPLVGFAENIPLFVEVTRPDGSVSLETAPNQWRLFNYQTFPREKTSETYRIFCMGGSTTHGRPYDDPVSFCGWLRAYLNAADPTRNWEVINAGGVSFASYRVAKLMNELKEYEADLFIVYTGQNEFLEERSYGGLIKLPDWLINLNATLSGTRIYTAMQQLFDAVRTDSPANTSEAGTLSGEVDEILNHSIGPESYKRDDTLKQQIITHFRLNLIRMARIARNADSDVIFIKPAINVKDMSPFKSQHKDGLDKHARVEWNSLYQRARALHEKEEFSEALALYRRALSIDDRYADLHYRIGQVYFERGQYNEAEQAFRRAVEEDIAPLRILDSMQDTIAQVASQEEAPLVNFPAIIRKAYLSEYRHAVFGEEYFLDHVHTNMEGYRLLALALFDLLVGQGVVTPDDAWNDARRQAVEQEVIAGLDPGIEGRMLMMLGKVLDWAGKFDEAYAAFSNAFEALGPSPMLYDRLARTSYIRGNRQEAMRYLREALEQFPEMPGAHESLAMLLEEQGKTDEAIAHCRVEIALDPANHSVQASLANLLEQKGDDVGALEHYQRSLALNPDNEYALVKLAHALIRLGRHDEALKYARDAVRINPQQYRAHYALGLILKKQGSIVQAKRHFSEAWRLQPGYAVAHENLHAESHAKPTGHDRVGKAPAAYGENKTLYP